ncbi:hypothetical protein DFQ28_005914 [Apophysomyces sp. BC1034]|nr:hypothetical protein DFQ30_005383 [Apophysomyces sp. BC1015]KAG0177484.1 hypothetical protein DFQ29_004783 [Apophysomyces sp. BC1021]KAG0187744.1 hypothetical protein DFQ28_005914 [Apophysomyces sp. BC1034]
MASATDTTSDPVGSMTMTTLPTTTSVVAVNMSAMGVDPNTQTEQSSTSEKTKASPAQVPSTTFFVNAETSIPWTSTNASESLRPSTTMTLTATSSEPVTAVTTTRPVESSYTYQYQNFSWLPNTFRIPVETTSTASTTSSATTQPDAYIPPAITPNYGAVIPASSALVSIKFQNLSYTRMVQDALLTADFVHNLPILVSKELNITVNDVIVVKIQPSNEKNSSQQHISYSQPYSSSGFLVSMALPIASTQAFRQLIISPKSSLYSPENGQLPTLIDSSYFDADSTRPGSNMSNNGKETSAAVLSKGFIIAIGLAAGIVVYTSVAIITLQVYRRRAYRQKQEEETNDWPHAPDISSSITHENSPGWMAQYDQHPVSLR